MFSILFKIFRFLFKAFLVLFILANLFILISGKFYLYRAVYYTYLHGQSGPGIFDKDYFPSREVAKGNGEPWPVAKNYGKLKIEASERKKIESFATTSFLVFKNDSLLYEEYFDGFDKEKTSNSFSMAKSVVGLLIGVAIDEGKIKSIDEPVGNYLADYKKGNRAKITIRHLLTMSAAMVWNESGGNPLSDNAEAYYGTNLTSLMQNVEYDNNPGKYFDYKSGTTQVLAMVLEKATEKKLSDYASEKIWKKIGAENNAFWSLDHEGGVEKAYCCMYATSRDYARLGKLLLHYGKWNNEQIIDSAYVVEATRPADLLIPDGGKNDRYGFKIWCTTYNNKPLYYLRGIKGQYVVCLPSENMIIVRTGHKRGEKRNDDQPEDLFNYIDAAMHLK